MTENVSAEVSSWCPPANNTGMELLPNPGDPIIVKNGNEAATTPGSRRPTTFILDGPYFVSQFVTYHYGARKAPGLIGLRRECGRMFGPWQAAGAVGQGGVPNAYWYVQPRIVLEPGQYTVIDSDPPTWSTEPITQGAGDVMIWGRRVPPHE